MPTAPAPTAPTAPKSPAPTPNTPPKAGPDTKTAPPAAPDPFKDAFADIDSMEAGNIKPPKKEQPKKEAVKTDPSDADGADSPSDISTIKTDSEEQESAKAATQDTKGTSEQKLKNPKELREAYDNLKKKLKEEYEPKLKKLPDLEAKLKELETKNPELEKAAKAKTEAIEKRNQELEAAIRLANYRQSKEYKEHETTLAEAWQTAEQKLSGIQLSSVNAEGQEEARAISMADIAAYGNMDPKDRWKKLKADIPDPAERTAVINHIDKIIELTKVANKAEQKAKEDAEIYSKTQQEQQEQLHQTRTKLWRESNEALAKQFPQWFSKSDDDPEGNTIFSKGAALADLAMFPQELSDEMIDLLPKSVKENIQARKPFTEQQVAKLRSIVRNKAANHDRLLHKNKALVKELEEARKSLKEYEESSPDKIQARQPGAVKNGADLDWKNELDELDRKGASR